MTLGQRSGKTLLFLVMVLVLFLPGTFAYAESDSVAQSSDEERVYGQQIPEEKSVSEQFKSESPTLFGVISRIIIFLFILTAGGAAIIHYARKGKFSLAGLKPIGTENKLIILETRMLGNRQYLTVVEYNEQKMLLGVSPGKIEQLCFLESVYEEEEGVSDTEE